MQVVGRQVRVDTCVNYSLCQLANKGKKRDRLKVLEDFIIELERFEDRHNMGFFKPIKVGCRE